MGSRVLHRVLGLDNFEAVKAKGSYIFASTGEKLLDACGGAAVVSIGHCDQRVIDALLDQMTTVNYCHSGMWKNQPSEQLAKILCESAGMDLCLFANGGTEAVESALKLARQHFVESSQPERVHFIGRHQSYHGNSIGCLAAGGHTARRGPFIPLLPHTSFHKVSPCNAYRYKHDQESDQAYVSRLKQELEDKFNELGGETVAAFIAEPVVGATTGCVPAVPGYFKAMREVCDKFGALMIFDEVMCGMGRTGRMHAWEWEDIHPDIQVIAKGLSGGYAPCSAVLASARVIEPLKRGTSSFNNGFTYQNWAVGARAALEVVRIIEKDNLLENCLEMGRLLEARLKERIGDHRMVGNLRGRGLFWGVEFVSDRGTKEPFDPSLDVGNRVFEEVCKRKVVVYPGKGTADGVRGDHILIAPPYIITVEEIDLITGALKDGIDAVAKDLGL
ncbi:aminotransferase, class III [Violaceomyces palustris]|uniref:Aminotransferase, class III n=1 Tax=Violaceomyces palustris TaxID=1673888 RepID=A0ACD0P1I2_9BASI|nr:aminotransferase, class III [Violaceomyces palustris]